MNIFAQVSSGLAMSCTELKKVDHANVTITKRKNKGTQVQSETFVYPAKFSITSIKSKPDKRTLSHGSNVLGIHLPMTYAVFFFGGRETAKSSFDAPHNGLNHLSHTLSSYQNFKIWMVTAYLLRRATRNEHNQLNIRMQRDPSLCNIYLHFDLSELFKCSLDSLLAPFRFCEHRNQVICTFGVR